jgi:hypothetical protein
MLMLKSILNPNHQIRKVMRVRDSSVLPPRREEIERTMLPWSTLAVSQMLPLVSVYVLTVPANTFAGLVVVA